jgi:hypothetical protein
MRRLRDPARFVGRTELIRDCTSAINSPTGLISVFGKRGVGKSSLLRQIQQIALGDYSLAKRAGMSHLIPANPRRYLTVYYSCDSMIQSGRDLLSRLCNDHDEEDSLLRLVPNDGKEITEFSRAKEVSGGADLKVVNWGAKGIGTSKYAKVVPDEIVQTFRNFVGSVVVNQVQKRMKRDGLLILLDEFGVISDKDGLGSLIKSLTTPEVKFAVCGIGRDLTDLVQDHASVERLIEQGVLPVKPMPQSESEAIVGRAAELFQGAIRFEPGVATRIASIAQGYPYFVQLIGKQCVEKSTVSRRIVALVLSCGFVSRQAPLQITDGGTRAESPAAGRCIAGWCSDVGSVARHASDRGWRSRRHDRGRNHCPGRGGDRCFRCHRDSPREDDHQSIKARDRIVPSHQRHLSNHAQPHVPRLTRDARGLGDLSPQCLGNARSGDLCGVYHAIPDQAGGAHPLVVIRQGICRILIEGPTVALRFNHLGNGRLRPATVGHEPSFACATSPIFKRLLRNQKPPPARGRSVVVGRRVCRLEASRDLPN